jgi:hypothetical protein
VMVAMEVLVIVQPSVHAIRAPEPQAETA